MKIDIINKNNLFKNIYKKAKYDISKEVITYVQNNKIGRIRIGITTSKKIGKAVKRNRAKRIIKEAFVSILKENEELRQKSLDFVFVARAKTTRIKMQHVKKSIFLQLKNLNIL